MAFFTSTRERRLWTWAAVAVVAIYSTLGLANTLAEALGRWGITDALWIAGLAVTTVVVAALVLSTKPDLLTLAALFGIAALFFMALVRMASPVERSHMFEYALVSVLVYQALVERSDNGRPVPAPALQAIVVSSLIGWFDEALQLLIPDRVYDPVDVFFNALAATLAVAAASLVRAARRRRSRRAD